MKKIFLINILITLSTIIVCNSNCSFATEYQTITNNLNASKLSFEELVKLSKDKNQSDELIKKVSNILNSPYVHNQTKPNYTKFKKHEIIGDYIKVAQWNIARGMHLETIINVLNNNKKLFKEVNQKSDIDTIKEQIQLLSSSDILILNEVDNGMPRTEYKNIAEEIANKLDYNYAFATEFIEVDQCHLGLQTSEWSEEAAIFDGKPDIDKAKYKGLHGNAILSKYPLKNVRILRLPEAYDWYEGEKHRISKIEEVKRKTANKIFREEMLTEVRVGGRVALLADVEIPGLDTLVTVISVHLENRTPPKKRKKQLEFLLNEIISIKNPIILGGDFNTTGVDGSPTSIKKILKRKMKDPNFIARSILLYGNPYGLAIKASLTIKDFINKYSDPTVKNIPVISPNPERALFKLIAKTEFDDNYKFDFNGRKKQTSNNKKGNLGNSNQRGKKGFVPTFTFERHIGIGKYKLDWIFVKAYSEKNKDKHASKKLAPHFARTLFELNYAFNEPISDHVPITVDLPITDYSNNKLSK